MSAPHTGENGMKKDGPAAEQRPAPQRAAKRAFLGGMTHGRGQGGENILAAAYIWAGAPQGVSWPAPSAKDQGARAVWGPQHPAFFVLSLISFWGNFFIKNNCTLEGV